MGRSRTPVYRYGGKGTTSVHRLRVYVLLGIIFSIAIYQIYSCYNVSSVENRVISKQYSTVSTQTKERIRSFPSGDLVEPLGSEYLRTTATKERHNINADTEETEKELSKNVNDFDIVSHTTKKSLEFTKIISDAKVLNHDTKKSYEFTENIKDVDVFNDVTEKAYELTKNTSEFDIVSDVLSKANEMTKNVSKNTVEAYNLTQYFHQLCDLPSDLGPISVETLNISLNDIAEKHPEVKFGGRYSPLDCLARQTVAIIVPYRDRKTNLATFLNHMHPFLIKQKLDYGIFIVEQTGTQEFNRGKLLNVGFIEAGIWQCYIFHDIDLLPVDQRNVYSCDPRHPRLYDALAMLDGYEPRGRLQGNFGGVSALTEAQFNKVNGYSNGYWGWGGEDNDLYYRLTSSGYAVTQYNMSIARYKALKHAQKSRNPIRYRLLLQTMKSFQMDGLSTLKYRVESTSYHPLHTHIVVNVDQTYHELQDLFQENRNFKQLHERFVHPVARRNKQFVPRVPIDSPSTHLLGTSGGHIQRIAPAHSKVFIMPVTVCGEIADLIRGMTGG